jgi:hypothetical protein
MGACRLGTGGRFNEARPVSRQALTLRSINMPVIYVAEVKSRNFCKSRERADGVAVEWAGSASLSRPATRLWLEAVNLKVRSCLIDGEVVSCDEKGVAAFQLLRHRRNERRAFLYAFDSLELTAPTSAKSQSRCGRRRWRAFCARRVGVHLPGASRGRRRVPTRCKMGLEGMCLRGWDRAIDRADRPTR